MTDKLTPDELELATRLTQEFRDKRDLTSGHENQDFAPIERRTHHAKLVRLKIAEVKKGKYGAILLRLGAIGHRDGDRAERDRQLAQQLEIQAWLRRLLQSASEPNLKMPKILRVRSSNVIPFRP